MGNHCIEISCEKCGTSYCVRCEGSCTACYQREAKSKLMQTETPTTLPSTKITKDAADLLRLMSYPAYQKVVEILIDNGESTAPEIAQERGKASTIETQTYHILLRLQGIGLVYQRQVENKTHYRIHHPALARFVASVETLSKFKQEIA